MMELELYHIDPIKSHPLKCKITYSLELEMAISSLYYCAFPEKFKYLNIL